jgi:predicted dehydrogenase
MGTGTPLGLGIVGTGGWARSFWSDAQTCPEIELVTCWNRTPERAEKFAEQFDCEVSPTLEALVEHPRVEAIANFAANNFHRLPAELAAAAKKHVFTDKPIANTIEDAAAMIRCCEEAAVTLMVGHSSRYAGTARTLKSLLDSGRLGRLAMAEGNISPLMQLSIHMFDTMHCLFGPTRRVTALSNSSLLPSEIEDVILTLLEFESGLLAYVGTNYLSASASFLRIYGRDASAYSEEGKIVVAAPNRDEPWITDREEVSIQNINAPAAEMREFARAVWTGRAPETGGTEGLLALGVVWACLMSAQQGRPVEVREALGEAASLLP